MNRKLSVLIPVYNEMDSLHELYDHIQTVVRSLIDQGTIASYEIYFIDDGSTDSSYETIKELICQDASVHMISFRKNFGKAAALQAGFRHAEGDIIITMDADLQDDPNEIPRFIEAIDSGFDVVSGWKKERHDPLEKRLPSNCSTR